MNRIKQIDIQTLLESLPAYGTAQTNVYTKAITAPYTDWIWYPTEYDKENNICFGLVDGWELEMGDFSITEMLEVFENLSCYEIEPITFGQIEDEKGGF